jgi:hypothetical protein
MHGEACDGLGKKFYAATHRWLELKPLAGKPHGFLIAHFSGDLNSMTHVDLFP